MGLRLHGIQLHRDACVTCPVYWMQTAKGWAGIPRVRATFTGLMDEDIRVQLAACDALLSL